MDGCYKVTSMLFIAEAASMWVAWGIQKRGYPSRVASAIHLSSALIPRLYADMVGDFLNGF